MAISKHAQVFYEKHTYYQHKTWTHQTEHTTLDLRLIEICILYRNSKRTPHARSPDDSGLLIRSLALAYQITHLAWYLLED